MACAMAISDFFSVAPQFNPAYFDDEPGAPQPVCDAVAISPEDAAIDAELAQAEETTAEVDALVAFAFATPAQTYDLVSATIAGFTSKDLQHEDYRAMFTAAARVALERTHPVLFQEWLAGNDSEEIKTLVGAELSKLRPSTLVFKEPAPRAPRKAKSTARFLRFDA
jgi:hypothetical protein